MRDICIHEAGHVVAAVVGGMAVDLVSIDPKDQREGIGITHVRTLTPLVALAGAAAEVALLGQACCGPSPSDLGYVPGGTARGAWYAAYRLMRRHRAAVEVIADQISRRRSMRALKLYEDVLPGLFPNASHPRLMDFEPSYSEWAAEQDRLGLLDDDAM